MGRARNDDSVTLEEVDGLGLNGASFPLDDAGENRLEF